jgi:uncharacterized membrane protein YfcA
MCDTISPFQTLFFFGALLQSLVPNNIIRYIALGIILLSWAIYAVHQTSPTTRLARLEDAIKYTEEILERAMHDCAHDPVDLMQSQDRLRQ